MDCLGLLVGVARELGLRSRQGVALETVDRRDYTHYPSIDELRQQLAAHLHELHHEVLLPGDVLLLAIEGRAQHLAMVSEVSQSVSIIHAYAPARKVVEHVMDAQWKHNIVAIFRVA